MLPSQGGCRAGSAFWTWVQWICEPTQRWCWEQGMQDHEHPVATRVNGLRYLFTAKHHGGWKSPHATWLPTLTDDQEFSVFDDGDANALSDGAGNLFGALSDGQGGMDDLGTRCVQIDKFWRAHLYNPWHAYTVLTFIVDAATPYCYV